MSSDDPLQMVRMRNNFYRDNYRRVMSALLACLLIIVLLLGVIFYLINHRPTPKYFATNAQGKIIPLQPLNRPNQTEPTVLQWASQAVVAAYSMDYVNYQGQLQYASQYFTNEGWGAFVDKLQSSNNLEAVKEKHLIQHAVATGAPVIIRQSVINDAYTWQIQMPLLVVLESASTTIQQPLTVTILVRRVSTLDNPKGIQISQFVSTPRVGQQ